MNTQFFNSRWRKSLSTAALVSLNFLGVANSQAGELQLLDTRISGVYASNDTGSTYSGVLSWLPSYSLTDSIFVKGVVGVTAYKGYQDSTEAVLNSGLLFGYSIIPSLTVEVGGGMQTWFAESSYPMGSLNLAWVPSSPIFGRINKVVGGYNYVASDEPANEFQVGIEINFGTIIGGVAQSDPSAPVAK